MDTPFAAREDALRLTRPPLDNVEPFRQHISRAIGEHERHGHAPINTNRGLGRKVANVAVLATEADLPAKGREADGRLR